MHCVEDEVFGMEAMDCQNADTALAVLCCTQIYIIIPLYK